MTEEELRDYQMWTMEDLQDYLLQTVPKPITNTIPHLLIRAKFKIIDGLMNI